MKNKLVRCALASVLAAAFVLAPATGLSQDKPKAAPGQAPDGPAQRTLPFRGKVTAIDEAAKTVTVGERVFHITAETRIVKDNQNATLAGAKVGDEIAGSYLKADDGKLVARMIRFGPKPEEPEKPAKPAKPETPATKKS